MRETRVFSQRLRKNAQNLKQAANLLEDAADLIVELQEQLDKLHFVRRVPFVLYLREVNQLTFIDIGKILKVSTVRANQIYRRAVKLRNHEDLQVGERSGYGNGTQAPSLIL